MSTMMQVKEALALVLGKCPRCGERNLTRGNWLKWCNNRACMWVGPLRRDER
jgi:hypothetical protein